MSTITITTQVLDSQWISSGHYCLMFLFFRLSYIILHCSTSLKQIMKYKQYVIMTIVKFTKSRQVHDFFLQKKI